MNPLLSYISIVVLVLVAVISAPIAYDSYACKNYSSITERETKYSIVSGCFVKQNGSWIPQEEMTKK